MEIVGVTGLTYTFSGFAAEDTKEEMRNILYALEQGLLDSAFEVHTYVITETETEL